VGLCGFMISTPIQAYMGEDIGINMYRELDSKYRSLYSGLLDRRLGDILERLNEKTATLPACKEEKGCFDT